MTEQPSAKHAPWATALNSLELDRLRTVAAQVKELEDHPGWKFLRELARAKQADLHRMILPPAPHEHYEYVALTNQEWGIGLVCDLPDAIAAVAQQREEAERRAAERAARKENR